MNYFDMMSEKWADYMDFLNRRQIQATSPKVKIYPLYRKNGPSDKVINEEINKIYLPYYSLRGHYLAQTWDQMLTKTAITEEDNDSTTIVFNMEDMTKAIRSLKVLHKSEIILKYSGNQQFSIWKNGNIMFLKINYILSQINLTFHSIKTLKEHLNSLIGFSVIEFKDGFENATNIIDFDEFTLNTNEAINIYTLDNTYQALDDKINIGDIIMTHHKVLYEVGEAKPGNLQFFNWPQYITKCFKKPMMDNTKLPDNGLNEIYEDGYLMKKYKNINFIN